MAGRMNISSKFDYIPYKELIHSGSPTIYQLTPEKENIDDIKKITIGKQDPNKTKRTIVLVGETGAGKSTLINALVNYAMGVTWEDNVWFEIVEKEEKRDPFESQTSDVIVYEIFGFEDKTLPYSLTIIDTPGYGDTKGTEKDSIVRQRLFDLLRFDDGVYEINAIGLVLKASDNRPTDRLRYVFDSVVSLFGKDMEKNIVALITHSDGKTPKEALRALEAAKIKCAYEKNQPVHFLFNNCQTEERNQNNKDVLEVLWEITSRGMGAFTNFLQNSLPRNLKTTANVLESRISLTASIQNLQERVELIELQQKEIQQSKEALVKYEREKESNKNFTVEVDEPYKEKERIRGGRWAVVFYEGAVTCKVCEENCHYPGCTMAWSPKDCEVMRRGRCTSCRGKCPVSNHEKKTAIYVTKTKKVTMTLQDIEEKYEKSKAESENTSDAQRWKGDGSEVDHEKEFLEALQRGKSTIRGRKEKYDRSEEERTKVSNLLEDLERRMSELQRDREQCLIKSFDLIVKLEQMALKVDSLSTLVHLDFLIEKMKENGENPEKERFRKEVEKLEEMRSRVDEGTKAALQYKIAAAGRTETGKTT